MRKIFGLLPAAAAIVYPFVLQAFHQVVSPPDVSLSAIRLAAAAVLLALAFALPLSGLRFAYWLTRAPQPSQSDLCACRLAYASIAAPPLFVFLGVARGLLGIKVPEIALWIGFWALAALYAGSGRSASAPNPTTNPPGTLRVVHGVSGVRLAWRWSSLRKDAYRIFQIGSGAYLAAYILTHLNSALISARTVHKIDTNWAWASGAPVGLIHDAWSIRLLPHYALGVFFILGHLSSGLRVIMLAHGTRTVVADRVWAACLAAGALIATAIMCALCGFRI
jgi:hypothetical protein